MEKKKCKRCGKEKEYTSVQLCEKCRIEKNEEIYTKHKKRVKEAILNKLKKNDPFLGIKNRLRRKIQTNKKYKEDKEYQIGVKLRNRFKQALKTYSKTGKIATSREYGIDYEAIIKHLTPFPEDIQNYHIDHIRPLCSFNLNDPEEIKKAFAPENHRWLLAEDNLAKIKEDKLFTTTKC